MGEVVRLLGGTVTLQAAVDAFLEHQDLACSTRRVYHASLSSLVAEFGPTTAVEICGATGGRLVPRPPRCGGTSDLESGTGDPAAAVRWWRRRGWLAVDPTADLVRRREQVDRTRALTRRQLEGLFARRDLALRERTLWRLLYETAAGANELLALDVDDLDLANRRARVHSKGGARGGAGPLGPARPALPAAHLRHLA